ncbi:hypothetical protein HK104_002129 [Borealophlyctis nickersoniae]|nr:hypothetical protein HK104_002129 [Borealophlyctis nickersoniae]
MAATRTFAHQSSLPRLPIPTLQETADRYVTSLRPVLSEKELENTSAFVTDFIKPGGFGEELQKRLIAHDRNETSSWLERWWLRLAYHSWRESLLVNSNWYIMGRDHPETPKDLYEQAKGLGRGFTDFQIKRAAGAITNLLDYKDTLDSESLPPERTKTGFLDMNQYCQIFGVTRVPKEGCDVNVGRHPANGRHIIVLVRDQIYVVDVYSDAGARVAVSDIEKQLKTVTEDVVKGVSLQTPVCLYTGVHRDSWAKMYEHLETLGPSNANSFFMIQTALFAVSLDDYSVGPEVDNLARNCFHGDAGHNRWFDKAISIIVSNDGRMGMNGEHSPCDALVPAMVFDYCVEHEPAKDPANIKPGANMKRPRRLTWETDEKVVKGLTKAQAFVDKTIADSDVSVLHFLNYGSDVIKREAKVSPDAFMQMAIQLTFYRLHNFISPVYETASTRQFLHGRTETCRSLSVDSKAFVLAFQNPKMTATEKHQALQKACSSHVKYLTAASNGRGCDRHLLGLRVCMREGESAEIFTDPAYAKSSRWQLSTSGLFPGLRLLGTGFGAVDPEGYGMNYMIGPKMIKVGIESKKSCAATSTQAFKNTLEQSLKDMMQVCQAATPAAGSAAKAKL